MKAYVHEQLLEARRRTLLHCRVGKRTPTEDQQADKQPSGFVTAVVSYLLAVALVAGLIFATLWVLR